MKSQRLKDVYFVALRPASKLNGLLWYFRNRFKCPKTVWLNLGCGDKYAYGFVNIDGNIFKKKDMWLDLRNGLPFPTKSVDAIYSCHVLEHFYVNELKQIVSECFRVLKSTGGIRILVPSLEQAIYAYVAGNRDWFTNFPSAYDSLGGKFFNFVFCESQHRSAFDFSFINELLQEVGFQRVVQAEPGKSNLFSSDALAQVENVNEDYIQTSLLIEARKE